MKHRWADPIRYTPNSTVRTCERCGILRITRHEPGNFPPHWVEFERDGAKVAAPPTPACVDTAALATEAAE
ncbi:MAG: hypothetical protein JWQ01_4924 [Massilia sp.]|nr:hypothetical protein [Massilia sp.]